MEYCVRLILLDSLGDNRFLPQISGENLDIVRFGEWSYLVRIAPFNPGDFIAAAAQILSEMPPRKPRYACDECFRMIVSRVSDLYDP